MLLRMGSWCPGDARRHWSPVKETPPARLGEAKRGGGGRPIAESAVAHDPLRFAPPLPERALDLGVIRVSLVAADEQDQEQTEERQAEADHEQGLPVARKPAVKHGTVLAAPATP